MLRFELEDFFDEFEHRRDLINLASSDALPWAASDLGPDVLAEMVTQSLGYPNPKQLVPALESALAPPQGVGVLPTSGAAEAIALAIHEIAASRTQRDCLVALPSPSYGAFQGLASLLGVQTRQYVYRAEAGWRPDLDEMLELATRCSAFVINNPHNPTGHVLPDEFLKRLSGTLSEHGAFLIVDEVFRFPTENRSAIGLDSNVVVLGSISKTHGLPGVRLGWIAAERKRLSRYRTIQQYLSLALNTFSVVVGRSALNELAKFDRFSLVQANRTIVTDWAASLSKLISTSTPMGGTTLCIALESEASENALFDACLGAGVLVAPGNRCFERGLVKAWFRVGYGTNTSSLERGLAVLEWVLRDQSGWRSKVLK